MLFHTLSASDFFHIRVATSDCYVQYSKCLECLESARKWVSSYSRRLWSNPPTLDESSAGWLSEGHALGTNKHRADDCCSPVKLFLSQCSWSAIYRAWNVNKVLHIRTLSIKKYEIIAAVTYLVCVASKLQWRWLWRILPYGIRANLLRSSSGPKGWDPKDTGCRFL
jgi:hypothetical protein